jgi:glycosyltransferase involved in cell wall biosynthesis
MHVFGLIFFGLIAVFWLTHGLRVAFGATQLPWVRDFPPVTDAECPCVSILFAARDEAEKLPAALATLMEIDYPHLEVVAVDDRSQDATGKILDEFAAAHSRLRVVHVTDLPTGWLGKPHALQKAYETATGEWLIFTDADVRFKPDLLRRSMGIVRKFNADHLTLLCDVEMIGFWETLLITFFGLGFHLAVEPSRASDTRSSRYIGVGAFQLLRRTVYEACGTHCRLAMEVVDDMKLGKLVKQAGFRSVCGVAQDFVVVRWHAGLGNLVRGVTKNFFAGAGYNLALVAAQLAGLLMMNVAPFVGVFFAHGWMQLFCAVAVAIAVAFHAGVAIVMRVSPLYALTHPLGALIFSYMLLRSTVVTLRQGGIVWRDTFYPLEELKRGVV